MSSAGTVSPAPPGYVINLAHPEYVGYQLVICSAITTAFSTVFLCLRLYTRRFLVRNWDWDDYWILVAWTFAVALTIGNCLETKYGMGKHVWDIQISSFNIYLKLQLFVGAAYIGALTFVKISICCFYLRLSPARTLRFLAILLMGFTSAYSFAGFIVLIFSCNPIAASWDLSLMSLPTTTCVNRPAEYLAQSILNIITDICIFILPLPTIWNLQLPFRQKLGVSSIIAIGLLVCIVSIIRLKSVSLVLYSTDPSWDTNRLLVWSTVEVHTAIVCACIATLKPFLKRFFPSILGKGSSSAEGPSYTFQGKGTKLGGGPSHSHSIALQSYHGAEVGHQHTTTVTSNGGRDPRHRDGDTESQTSIMRGIERGMDAKEGVTITRTVQIS